MPLRLPRALIFARGVQGGVAGRWQAAAAAGRDSHWRRLAADAAADAAAVAATAAAAAKDLPPPRARPLPFSAATLADAPRYCVMELAERDLATALEREGFAVKDEAGNKDWCVLNRERCQPDD